MADGETGELVFTTLTKEALPFLRYRTGDLASLTREPCPCGRTLARMSRVLGRTDDMLVIRGVNVFPSEVERALLAMPAARPALPPDRHATGPARRARGRGRGARARAAEPEPWSRGPRSSWRGRSA